MRIVSGKFRGRKLVPLQGKEIRPTSDRVREAIFNILGPRVRDARVLDLFAGTGALGLEALSRGARHAVFMDAALDACAIIQLNIALCRMADQTTLIHHDMILHPFPPLLKAEPFDLIFMDPPYARGYIEITLGKAAFPDLLTPHGIMIVEQSHKESLALPMKGLDIYRQKKYSRTFVSFIRKYSM